MAVLVNTTLQTASFFAGGGERSSSVWQTLVAILASIKGWVEVESTKFGEWIQKDVWVLVVVWFIVFWLVMFTLLAIGFGSSGIIAGSLAAGFQSWMYGAFTPAGGVFAVLTSIGMMGFFATPQVVGAVVVASVVTAIVALLR